MEPSLRAHRERFTRPSPFRSNAMMRVAMRWFGAALSMLLLADRLFVGAAISYRNGAPGHTIDSLRDRLALVPSDGCFFHAGVWR